MTKTKDLLRVEAFNKLTGKAKYIDDLTFPEMLHGATIRAEIPRGLLKSIEFDPSINWNEFVIVTAKDIPGKNFISMIENDWPVLVEEKINNYGEAVALIAHPNKWMLEKARKHIKVVCEALTPVLTLDESIAKKEVIWGQDNVLKHYHLRKGNITQSWAEADFIIENTYETGAQEQLYIENNGMIAQYSETDGITVWGSLQCPYYIHEALMPVFQLPEDKVRVIQVETGGGFGGKEDFPSLLASHAGLLAKKAGRPVKMIYSRMEDMANTTKRHPSRTRHKTAVRKDGKILGMEIEFFLDGGAYLTLSSVVLSRGCIHSAGPYLLDNVDIRATAYATNHFPYGAFRGFGAPQSIFALERHMDFVAHQIGITPEQMRRVNFLKTDQRTATNQLIHERLDMDAILNRAFELSDYKNKMELYKEQNKKSHIKKGLGFATFFHGAGFTGSGEAFLASIAAVQGTKEGKIEVLASSTEMGQGKNTVFTEIVSSALGVHPDDVMVINPDTKFVPDSGPTVASRTCMIVGKLIQSAAIGLKQQLIAQGFIAQNATREDILAAIKKYNIEVGKLRIDSHYQQPPNVYWNDTTYQGEAYATYAWATYLAEVSVNTLTYETKVDHFWAVQEVGKVLNKTLAEGQIEGGVTQGIGYAIYEKVVEKNGVMINNQLTNYIIPTAKDVPELHIDFLEWNQEHGPGGAKGIGELPMDGPGPAILNAIANATQTEPTFIPLLPEDMMKLLNHKKENSR